VRLRTIAGNRIVQGMAAVALAGMMALAFLASRTLFTEGVVGAEVSGTVESVGKLLLSEYLMPFELTSVLLLVAIVGAVVLARKPTE
jgi:NADH-quinone oxidoreductase subunit J